jgi:hypothetical protein
VVTPAASAVVLFRSRFSKLPQTKRVPSLRRNILRERLGASRVRSLRSPLCTTVPSPRREIPKMRRALDPPGALPLALAFVGATVDYAYFDLLNSPTSLRRVTSHDWRNHFIAALMFSAAQSSYLGPHTLPPRECTGIHGRVLDGLSKRPIVDLEIQLIEVDRGGVRAVRDRFRAPPACTLTQPGGFRSSELAQGRTTSG